MLANNPVHAALPASDLERAKRFYAEKLGLTPQSEMPGGVFYECGAGTRFLVYPSGGTASGTHTQLGWAVGDIEAEVADLKKSLELESDALADRIADKILRGRAA